MTPSSKKGRAVAKEIGNMIEVYLDDPSDSNLEMMHAYFEDILTIIKGVQKKRNVDAEGENKKP